MGVGLFLQKHFQNKEIEFLSTMDAAEWILKAESNQINHLIIHAIFIAYDQECEVITFAPIYDQNLKFYVAESNIIKFWEPPLNIMRSAKTTVAGHKLYDKKRDIM